MTPDLRLAVRQVRLGTAVIAGLVAGLSAIVVAQYRFTFADTEAVATLQALSGNPAIRVLFGEPLALDTAGGFTVWRTGMFAAVTLGLWGALTATGITRGEEQAGRWCLLLTGSLRLPRVVLHHLAVLVVAQLMAGIALWVALAASGAGGGSAVLYSAAITLIGMTFVGVGLAAGQLVDDRRTASGLSVALLLIALLVRMVADGVTSLAWLSWLSPFGLLAESAPYAYDRVAPIGVLALFTVIACGLSFPLAAHRDLGRGMIAAATTRRARPWLLRNPLGFAVRRTAPATAAWALGLAAYFLLIGLLARSLTTFLVANRQFSEPAAQAGFVGLDSTSGYLATLFALLAIILGVYAASRLNLDSADETAGRLAVLLAKPLSRVRWSLTQLAVVTVGISALALIAAGAAETGITVVGAELALTSAIAGALNVLPVPMLCLGAAQFARGWMPRLVFPIGAAPAVGGFLLTVFADTFNWPHWVAELSPFAHLARVPLTTPDWPGTIGIITVAALLAALGVIGFSRRDIRA